MNKKTKRLILILTIILTLTLTVNTLAKYINSTYADTSADVALFIVEDTLDTISFKLSEEEITPGNTYTYTFDVSNFKDDKRSEVNIDYIVKIESSENLPLTYELLKNGNSLVLTDNVSEVQTMTFDNNQTDKYTLKITFPDIEESYVYAGMVEYIDITIDAEQKI